MTSAMQFKINGPQQPFDSLGLFTLLRTYSRRVNENDPNSPVENWAQILTRCINACNDQLKCGFTQEEAQEFFDLLYNRKASLAGRFLWQLGTKTVDKLGLMSLQNCAFCVIDDLKSFTWIMNFLMLGAGCGYRILQEDIDKFPVVKYVEIVRRDEKDSDYIVPDSRQGWVKLLGKALKAHFYSGKGFTYSTHLLRSKGAPIKSFGGVSSGPEVLCDGIAKISDLLNKRSQNGGKLTTTDALDIANIIGMVVVSGNVRRCLPKGSLVYVQGGLKMIETIQVGDSVLTTKGFRQVKNVFEQGVQPLVKIKTTQGSFRCTANHRMATRTFSNPQIIWKMASELDFADYILSLESRDKYAIADLNMERVIDVSQDGESETWDIEVDEMHEFFCNSYLTHNSAQIALGDVKDTEFLRAKRWDLGTIPNWRCYSNNSVICNDINDVLDNDEFWCGYQGNGEPYGLINLKLAQSCGRLGETQYPDPEVEGVNPCVSGDTLILTDKGEIPVIDLVGKGRVTLVIDGKEHLTTDAGFFKTSDLSLLYKITTKLGKTVRATADHKFLQLKGWTELKNIQIGDILRVNSKTFFNIDPNEVWEEVVSINEDGYEPVYDCTVPTIHCFSANGILAHNCSEQSLANYETCCLGEIYLPNVTSFEELKKCITYIYRACKQSLTLPCVDSKDTEDIVHKNMRMGIGYTGILQATDEQRSWIKPCYEYLREFDKAYSEKHNFPPSIKLSTVKPGGTLSLLGGCTAGIHPGYSRYYIRRIRVSSESKLIQLAKDHNYHVEYVQNFDGTLDYNTQVISFPYSLPEHTILAEDMTAIQQLEWVKWAQTNLSDNAVSVTVYYRKEELPEIKAWLKEHYNNSVKAVSFLLHSEHGFKQAPLEKISKEEYEVMLESCSPIVDVGNICAVASDEKYVGEGECVGGSCPLK